MANPDERLIELGPPPGSLEPTRLLAYLNKGNLYLNKLLAWVAGASLLTMVFVVVANVVSRTIHVPFTGTPEIVGWLAAVTIAFGLGFTQLQQGYVEIDALVERFPQGIQRIIKSIMLLASFCFFALVAWQLFLYGLKIAENGNLSETLGIPFYPVIFLVALGFAGLTLALLVDFLKELGLGGTK